RVAGPSHRSLQEAGDCRLKTSPQVCARAELEVFAPAFRIAPAESLDGLPRLGRQQALPLLAKVTGGLLKCHQKECEVVLGEGNRADDRWLLGYEVCKQSIQLTFCPFRIRLVEPS